MNSVAYANCLRILVVDDHGLVRDGLKVLLDRDASRKVVGSVATGRDAVQAARELRPDVIIMDLVLPDLNGIDATAEILAFHPTARIIILSASQSSEYVYRALRAGAMGYVTKQAMPTEIIQAVERVAADQRYLSPSIARATQEGPLHLSLDRSPVERLTNREREVLQRICEGASSAEIARLLVLSRKTVDTYRGRLMSKLGVGNRAALIRFAIEHRLTPP